MAVEGVVVEIDLAVERDELAFAGDDQRIDLHQRRVGLDERPVQRLQEWPQDLGAVGAQAQAESQLAHLKRLQARGRANRLAQNGRGILVGDFFDLHAAGSAGHDDRRFDGAVHQDAQVQLALDVLALFDEQALHQAAFRAGLRRDQRHAQNLGGELLRFVHRARQLDAAALAAPAGVNLRLHHDHLGAQALGDAAGVFGFGHHLAARRGNAEAAENLLGLIFVNLHPCLRRAASTLRLCSR